MTRKPKPPSEKKKDRVELEKQFLSCLLVGMDFEDLRQSAARYTGVTWRHFADTRHQVIWRALMTLDLLTDVEERKNVLFAEAKAGGDPDAAADPGSAGWKQLERKLEEGSAGPAWLERSLAAAGALAAAGGKVYVRAVCEAYPVSFAADGFAARLGFIQGGKR